ncbi:MAG: GIY-YIG nuclease family protein [Bacteroidota bacterium]
MNRHPALKKSWRREIPLRSTMYFVYILQSLTSGKFYVGHTDNLPKRVQQHNSGYNPSTKPG